MQHETGEGHIVEASQHLRQSLVIARPAAKARAPSKASLSRPAARQEHKAYGLFPLPQRLDDECHVDKGDEHQIERIEAGKDPSIRLQAPNEPLDLVAAPVQALDRTPKARLCSGAAAPRTCRSSPCWPMEISV